MRIYFACPVRQAGPDVRAALEQAAAKLEARGHTVYLPHRDTPQGLPGLAICRQNLAAIAGSDEVHLWYDESSSGVHFDLGVAFALGRPVRLIVDSPPLPPRKPSNLVGLLDTTDGFGRVL